MFEIGAGDKTGNLDGQVVYPYQLEMNRRRQIEKN